MWWNGREDGQIINPPARAGEGGRRVYEHLTKSGLVRQQFLDELDGEFIARPRCACESGCRGPYADVEQGLNRVEAVLGMDTAAVDSCDVHGRGVAAGDGADAAVRQESVHFARGGR